MICTESEAKTKWCPQVRVVQPAGDWAPLPAGNREIMGDVLGGLNGAHTCIGALHARVLFRTLLQWLVDHVSRIEVIERQEHIESISQFERPLGYDKLVVRLVRRD